MALSWKKIESVVKKELDGYPEWIIQETLNILQNYKSKITSEKKLKEILNDIKARYEDAKVEEFYPVGVVTAESIAEPLTQLTMRTFHYAGIREFKVTLALDRVLELLEARRTLKAPSMIIRLKPEYAKDFSKVREAALRLIETLLKDITKNLEVDIYEFKITIELDKEEMNRRGVTLNDVVSKVKSKKKRVKDVKVDSDRYIVEIYANVNSISDLYDLLQDLRKTRVKGIKGIKKVMIRQDEETGEYYIQTEGTNLKQVLRTSFVDPRRTYSNDIHEVEKVLGIEAARELLIRELYYNIYKAQGIDVDIRHIMLLADMLTWKGKVTPIGRRGLVKDKDALVRMAFEETGKQLANAAYGGEEDSIRSVISSIIVGKPISLGTGAVVLRIDYEKYLKRLRELEKE
jgi:DNA-directed RNA polymerase subunit A"